MEDTIKVYVQVNTKNVIVSINSSIFITDLTAWIQIDEGARDKYAHAQSNYLDKGLVDMQGKYNYKLVDGKVVELTDMEKENLFPTPASQPTEVELLKQQLLETQSVLAEIQYNILLNGGNINVI